MKYCKHEHERTNAIQMNRDWKFCPYCGERLEESEYMDLDDFIAMFRLPLLTASKIYNANKREKGDSWKDGGFETVLFLRSKLMEEITEYFDGETPVTLRYKEICDVINVALMLACREHQEMCTELDRKMTIQDDHY